MNPMTVRRPLVAAAGLLLWTLSVMAAPPGRHISGNVNDAAGNPVAGAIVGLKAVTQPNPENPLADPELTAVTNSAGFYQVAVAGSTTYRVAAVSAARDAGQVTTTTLPGPVKTTVMASDKDSVQHIRLHESVPPIAVTGAGSPTGEAPLAVDGSLGTAWRTADGVPAQDRVLTVDLGEPLWLAETLLWWDGAVPTAYRLQASQDYNPQDGSGTWTDVYASTSGKGSPVLDVPGVYLGVVAPVTPVRARFVRVIVDTLPSGATSAGLAEVSVVDAPPLTGTVTDVYGNPVAGATVGGFLDGGPFVTTDPDGRYTLPLPLGQPVIGAHRPGSYLSGPRWLDNRAGPTVADFTLFPTGADILQGANPAVGPADAAGNITALTDGDTATLWESGRTGAVTPELPTRLVFDMNGASVSGVEVRWKNPPAAWHVEMSFDVTYSNGKSPHPTVRKYYSAGQAEGAAPDDGGYPDGDGRVTAIKIAPVTGVAKLAIVITKSRDDAPVSAYEACVYGPDTTGVADASAALRIAAGLQEAPTDPNAFLRWDADDSGSTRIDYRDAITLLRDLNREVQPLRVLVINYEPYIESEGGRLLRQVTGWFDPRRNTRGHVDDMELSSHDYLRIHMLPQIDADEYPVFKDGFRYTDATFLEAWRTGQWRSGSCDYNDIVRRYDIVRRVMVGDVDEVWLQAVPGFQMWETTMVGPNAYWCNSSPVPSPADSMNGTNGNRLFIITAFNYERDTDVMIHDWGHRMESIVGRKVYGSYYYGKTAVNTTFDRFARYEYMHPGEASVGNCHYPPNGSLNVTVPDNEKLAGKGYDYANETVVMSDADDWLNYPNLTGERKPVSRENWRGPRTVNGNPDWHRNHQIWLFSHLPHAPGVAPDGKLSNWWKYLVDPNGYPESR